MSNILICILTTHERNGWVHPNLSEWTNNLRFQNKHGFMIAYAKNFQPAASARNYFCRNMKDANPRPDWLCMIDNDMSPPENLLETIENAPEDASVIVPQFCMWDESKPRVNLCWGMDEKIAPTIDGHTIFDIGPEWYPLTKCGTGVIFIKPDVFDKISMPYFWYTYNEDQGMEATEDINFCTKVIAAGLKIYGNGRVVVGHYHNANVQLIPQASNKKVESPLDKQGYSGVQESEERPSELSEAEVCPTR